MLTQPTGCLDRPVNDDSKDLYPLRNRIIPNEATIRVQQQWGCRLNASCSPRTRWVGNYVISQRVWVLAFISWPMWIKVTGCWEITYFLTPHFSTDFDIGHGDNVLYITTDVAFLVEDWVWEITCILHREGDALIWEFLNLCSKWRAWILFEQLCYFAYKNNQGYQLLLHSRTMADHD